MSDNHNKITIIGTGPAGLTAAIYAARANLEPVVYAGMQHGGQLTTTTEVENFPGFKDPIMGPQLMSDMTAQAERVGAKILYEDISKVDFSTSPHTLWSGDSEFTSDTVIIATGATAKTLGLPEEAALMGRGISTCATCDGFFYKNKKVAVVGGGDSAMEEATYLAQICAEVHLIHRRDKFRASPIMLERAQKNPKITFHLPYNVTGTVANQSGLEKILVQEIKPAGEKVSSPKLELNVEGLFMAIGHTPNSHLFSEFLETDEHGYIKVHEGVKTNVKGVFAAGDIADPHFKQAITAAGMGCQAAISAQRYLESL